MKKRSTKEMDEFRLVTRGAAAHFLTRWPWRLFVSLKLPQNCSRKQADAYLRAFTDRFRRGAAGCTYMGFYNGEPNAKVDLVMLGFDEQRLPLAEGAEKAKVTWSKLTQQTATAKVVKNGFEAIDCLVENITISREWNFVKPYNDMVLFRTRQ